MRRQVVQDEGRRSRPSRSRSEVPSLIRSNHGAVRKRQPVYRPRIPNRRKSTLWLRVLSIHLHGDSVDRSRNIPRFGSQDGDAQRVGQYRDRRLAIRKDAAGRPLETAGSTCDLKGQSTVGHSLHEIDAITSRRDIDL